MKTYRLKHLDCADCAARIEGTLRELAGVRSVSVDFATLTMRIDADDMGRVAGTIRSIEPTVVLEDRDAAGKAGAPGGTHGAHGLGRDLSVLAAAGILFLLGMVFQAGLRSSWGGWPEVAVFAVAYLVAGWNVLAAAVRGAVKGRVFDENFLMVLATGGAFAIRQWPEAAAVMIFYKIGEILEGLSVAGSRRSIRGLLDLRPDTARVRRGGGWVTVSPEEVAVGEQIAVRPGERVPLDGIVASGEGFVDTSALTGEPVPRRVEPGREVLAGMIGTDGSLTIRVMRPASESGAARILALVEEASHAKARTERFIARFARFYTPAVVAAAALVAFLPPLLPGGGPLAEWVRRALTLLVISCPCALVISVPLAYFAGIGGASRRGILVKGAVHMDTLAAVKTMVFDKTGTLTRGVFRVLESASFHGVSPQALLESAAAAESHSNHPIAASIRAAYGRTIDGAAVRDVRETAGEGVSALVGARRVLVGNDRLMHREGIAHDACRVRGTVIHVALDGTYAGYLLLGDEVKEDARQAVADLRALGVERTVLLTGDGTDAARRTAQSLGIGEHHRGLLPADKVAFLERILAHNGRRGKTAFVGDGINDAPVLARSDVGIAMGGCGSDAAVETADVVLMTDSPLKAVEAVRRARTTRTIVVQNIVFALGVKAVFLALGFFGVATMWEAVIADMGVALLAILNAGRAMR